MIALLLATALAGPCDDTDRGMAVGPSTVNPRPGDLGSGHRVCPRTEVGGSVGGAAVIDAANFYGNLAGGLTAHGSLALDDKTELYAQVELIRYDALISAFSDSVMGPGHTMVGASRRVLEGESWGLAAHGRLVLPTAVTLYRHAYPFALDAGGTFELAAGPIRPHATLNAVFSFAASAGPADPWLGLGWVGGTEFRAGQTFGFLVDLSGTYGYGAGGLDHLSLDPGFRFGFSDVVGAELGFHMPMGGRARAPLGLELAVTGRWP
ncbi:MAG: hypothetical protein EP330_04030 [Deltaproteobacteria bacterium]|nr:MAG: hypothetical protein EP330_04030 [Deltaproteobacteria bacterium]